MDMSELEVLHKTSFDQFAELLGGDLFAEIKLKNCFRCNKLFLTKQNRQKYCSATCRLENGEKTKPEPVVVDKWAKPTTPPEKGFKWKSITSMDVFGNISDVEWYQAEEEC